MMNKQIACGQHTECYKYVYMVLVNERFAFVDHFKITHARRYLAEIPAQCRQYYRPDSRPQRGKQAETVEIHPRQPRRDRNQLADPRQQSADKCCQIPVFTENFFCPIQRRFFQEKYFP